MDSNIILSIYIATYCRSSIIFEKVKSILSVESSEFNIWVLDDCSDDNTFELLSNIVDSRLHVLRNNERKGCLKDGAMTNWSILLEACDGLFSMHLNDRDVFKTEELLGLIDFLKKHKDYSAGICDSYSGAHLYYEPKEAFIAIPYRASHPTGIIFNTKLYKSIPDRLEYFTKDRSYIHPHDLVLGELSQYGKFFEYNKVYNLANTESFANNKSFLYKKGSAKSSWFSPSERIKEFELFIIHMSSLDYKKEILKEKTTKIAKAYLYFCTFNYKYYITDEGQTKHYGIDPQKVKLKDLHREMEVFISSSTNILLKYKLLDNIKVYRFKLILYFWFIYIFKPVWEFYKDVTHRKW